jgi:hypothetical protein
MRCLSCSSPIEKELARLGSIFCLDCRTGYTPGGSRGGTRTGAAVPLGSPQVEGATDGRSIA